MMPFGDMIKRKNAQSQNIEKLRTQVEQMQKRLVRDNDANVGGIEAPEVKQLKEEVEELKSVVSKDKEHAKAVKKEMKEAMNKKFEEYTDDVENALQSNIDDPKLKEQLEKRNRIGDGKKKKIQRIGSVMKTKSKDNKLHKNVTTCTGGTKWASTELVGKKYEFCKGSTHLDLSNRNVKNVAIYYLKDQISSHYTDKHMTSVKTNIRYDVVDESCPSKLFDANDISIQPVALDTLGEEKEWVAVVHLNTKSDDGYLQSELPYCKAKAYLIGADVKVLAYIDEENCCNDYRDFNKCKTIAGCTDKLLELKDVKNSHFSRDIKLTGSHYVIHDTHHYKYGRRRRLLQGVRSDT
jgi:hypothetical protein